MKINLFASLLFILLLTGCATTRGYEQTLIAMNGASENALLGTWGVPARVFESGDSKYYIYNSSRNVYLPGSSPNYTTTFVGNTAYTRSYGGSAPANINYQCETTFELRKGKITSWKYRGNDCKAPESN